MSIVHTTTVTPFSTANLLSLLRTQQLYGIKHISCISNAWIFLVKSNVILILTIMHVHIATYIQLWDGIHVVISEPWRNLSWCHLRLCNYLMLQNECFISINTVQQNSFNNMRSISGTIKIYGKFIIVGTALYLALVLLVNECNWQSFTFAQYLQFFLNSLLRRPSKTAQ